MKLIFHIGAGKTGSTSIQRTLKENDALLKEKGVWYLGLMLERTNNKLFEWQQQAASVFPKFHQLTNDQARKQLLDVLHPIINEAKEKNIETLVWSNESFLAGRHNFTSALQQLQREGVEVEILIYVREYASWARSAYVQWGIKHKTYKGKLQTFEEWSQLRSPSFYGKMKNLLEIMPETVRVRNMSAVDDVVLDFLDYAQIERDGIKVFRNNDSPKNEELLLRALFNSKYDEKVLPVRFANVMGRQIPFSKSPKEFLEDLLPNKYDLENVLTQTSDDRRSLNQLLLSQGQSALENDGVSLKSVDVNSEKLVLALADVVMQQSRRIEQLEKLIKRV